MKNSKKTTEILNELELVYEQVKSKSKILKKYRVYFPNGFGASIVDNRFNEQLEIAVISKANAWGVDFNNDLYDNVIDVGRTPEDVKEVLDQISELRTDYKKLQNIVGYTYRAQDALRDSEYDKVDSYLTQILAEVDL